MRPETKYARSGDVHIAYQVTGSGSLDVAFVPGFVSHIELAWDLPATAHTFDRLGAFARLIRFDKRGTGMSDRVPVATLENGWTISGPSWMLWDPKEQLLWVSPKAAR